MEYKESKKAHNGSLSHKYIHNHLHKIVLNESLNLCLGYILEDWKNLERSETCWQP